MLLCTVEKRAWSSNTPWSHTSFVAITTPDNSCVCIGDAPHRTTRCHFSLLTSYFLNPSSESAISPEIKFLTPSIAPSSSFVIPGLAPDFDSAQDRTRSQSGNTRATLNGLLSPYTSACSRQETVKFREISDTSSEVEVVLFVAKHEESTDCTSTRRM